MQILPYRDRLIFSQAARHRDVTYCYTRPTFCGACVIDKMDELIEMPLGDTRVGQRSQVSDGNAHWHHLVNTNERSLRCVDAAISHQFAIISSLAQKSGISPGQTGFIVE